jgi:hypothetical protein
VKIQVYTMMHGQKTIKIVQYMSHTTDSNTDHCVQCHKRTALCCYNTWQVSEEPRTLWPSRLRTRGTDGLSTSVCGGCWGSLSKASLHNYMIRYVCALLGPHRQVRVRVVKAEALLWSFLSSLLMEVSGQLHGMAILSPGEEQPLPADYYYHYYYYYYYCYCYYCNWLFTRWQ